MLLPCFLQLDLMGQKVQLFGITQQLLLFLTCSQTSATPCPTCTRKTAPTFMLSAPPPPPRMLSLVLLLPLEVSPISLRAFLGPTWCRATPTVSQHRCPKTSKSHQGSPMHLTHQGMVTRCPKLLCTNSANPDAQFILQPAQGCEPSASHTP